MTPTGNDILLQARHHVTNTLLRYLQAVDNRDVAGVVGELGETRVSFLHLAGPPP